MRDFSRGRYMSREYAAKINKNGVYTPTKDSTELKSRLMKVSHAPDETKNSEKLLKKEPSPKYVSTNFDKVLESMRKE